MDCKFNFQTWVYNLHDRSAADHKASAEIKGSTVSKIDILSWLNTKPSSTHVPREVRDVY